MSRLASHSLSRLAALLALGAALTACRDAISAPRNDSYAPLDAVQEREITLFVGDTLDMSRVLDVASASERGACTSDNASIAAIDGALFLIGASAGDVVLFCTRSISLETLEQIMSNGGEGVDTTSYRYQVTAHVRVREDQSTPAPDPTGEPLPMPDSLSASRGSR